MLNHVHFSFCKLCITQYFQNYTKVLISARSRQEGEVGSGGGDVSKKFTVFFPLKSCFTIDHVQFMYVVLNQNFLQFRNI